jgi:hypothetical protein
MHKKHFCLLLNELLRKLTEISDANYSPEKSVGLTLSASTEAEDTSRPKLVMLPADCLSDSENSF